MTAPDKLEQIVSQRPQELHLELLLGQRVYDSTARAIGRVEEVRAEPDGEDWVIQEYLIGTAAVLERLSAWAIGIRLLRMLGARKIYEGYCVPWDKLDLSDPQRPRLCCTLDELKQLTESAKDEE